MQPTAAICTLWLSVKPTMDSIKQSWPPCARWGAYWALRCGLCLCLLSHVCVCTAVHSMWNPRRMHGGACMGAMINAIHVGKQHKPGRFVPLSPPRHSSRSNLSQILWGGPCMAVKPWKQDGQQQIVTSPVWLTFILSVLILSVHTVCILSLDILTLQTAHKPIHSNSIHAKEIRHQGHSWQRGTGRGHPPTDGSPVRSQKHSSTWEPIGNQSR